MTGERCDNTAALSAALDAYAPARVAERTAIAGVAKATLPLVLLFTLAVLAGAFGAVFYLAVLFQLGPGVGRVLGGVAFSLGLFLIVVSGAELFTGNNLITLARCDGLIETAALQRCCATGPSPSSFPSPRSSRWGSNTASPTCFSCHSDCLSDFRRMRRGPRGISRW